MGRIEREALKISLVYGVCSGVYILGSNRLLYYWVKDPNLMSWIATAKGWGFVAITCILLYFLVHNFMQEHARAEEQAWQAQKSEALGRMAAGVAHDFNNILQVVAAASQLGSELTKDQADVEDLFAKSGVAAQRGRELVRHLMAFARQEPSRPRVLAAEELVVTVERLLTSVVRSPHLIKIKVEPGTGSMLLDPVQMEQVLLNLVVNAVDAMPGPGTVSLTLRPEGERIAVEVQDTGVGIPAEILPHIFEPFFTTKGGKGTGLGLATVEGIVAQWKGTVEVSSHPGKGTRFTLRLPRVAEAAAPR